MGGAASRDNDVVRIRHAGGYLEEYDRPVSAHEVMLKHPWHWITRPEVFKEDCPDRLIIPPEKVLCLGEFYFLVSARVLFCKMVRKGVEPQALYTLLLRQGVCVKEFEAHMRQKPGSRHPKGRSRTRKTFLDADPAPDVGQVSTSKMLDNSTQSSVYVENSYELDFSQLPLKQEVVDKNLKKGPEHEVIKEPSKHQKHASPYFETLCELHFSTPCSSQEGLDKNLKTGSEHKVVKEPSKHQRHASATPGVFTKTARRPGIHERKDHSSSCGNAVEISAGVPFRLCITDPKPKYEEAVIADVQWPNPTPKDEIPKHVMSKSLFDQIPKDDKHGMQTVQIPKDNYHCANKSPHDQISEGEVKPIVRKSSRIIASTSADAQPAKTSEFLRAVTHVADKLFLDPRRVSMTEATVNNAVGSSETKSFKAAADNAVGSEVIVFKGAHGQQETKQAPLQKATVGETAPKFDHQAAAGQAIKACERKLVDLIAMSPVTGGEGRGDLSAAYGGGESSRAKVNIKASSLADLMLKSPQIMPCNQAAAASSPSASLPPSPASSSSSNGWIFSEGSANAMSHPQLAPLLPSSDDKSSVEAQQVAAAAASAATHTPPSNAPINNIHPALSEFAMQAMITRAVRRRLNRCRSRTRLNWEPSLQPVIEYAFE